MAVDFAKLIQPILDIPENATGAIDFLALNANTLGGWIAVGIASLILLGLLTGFFQNMFRKLRGG